MKLINWIKAWFVKPKIRVTGIGPDLYQRLKEADEYCRKHFGKGLGQ